MFVKCEWMTRNRTKGMRTWADGFLIIFHTVFSLIWGDFRLTRLFITRGEQRDRIGDPVTVKKGPLPFSGVETTPIHVLMVVWTSFDWRAFLRDVSFFLLHKLSMNDSLHYWFCFVTSFTKESMQLFWIRNVWKLRTYIQIQKKSKEGTSRVS